MYISTGWPKLWMSRTSETWQAWPRHHPIFEPQQPLHHLLRAYNTIPPTSGPINYPPTLTDSGNVATIAMSLLVFPPHDTPTISAMTPTMNATRRHVASTTCYAFDASKVLLHELPESDTILDIYNTHHNIFNLPASCLHLQPHVLTSSVTFLPPASCFDL